MYNYVFTWVGEHMQPLFHSWEKKLSKKTSKKVYNVDNLR